MNGKRKEYLKKWVEVAIIFIQAILFITLAGECDDLKIFIVSKKLPKPKGSIQRKSLRKTS